MADMISQAELDALLSGPDGLKIKNNDKPTSRCNLARCYEYVHVSSLITATGLVALYMTVHDTLAHSDDIVAFLKDHEHMHRFMAANKDIRQKFTESASPIFI